MSPVQDGAARNAEVAKLIAVLQCDAAPFDKAQACQRLALIGTKEAVPALAALLADERLSSYAQFRLPPIPDPSVDDALRDALGRLHGRLLSGVINSIGVRRDVKAVSALTKVARDPTSEAAPMALAALGQIATFEATETLQQVLASNSAAVRGAAAEACLVSVERLLARANGKSPYGCATPFAVQMCPAVSRRRHPGGDPRPSVGRSAILLAQLKVDDNDMFGIALRTSRELSRR